MIEFIKLCMAWLPDLTIYQLDVGIDHCLNEGSHLQFFKFSASHIEIQLISREIYGGVPKKQMRPF
ncbi:hypothetical protein CPT76_19340 [Paenibacillus sp. AR247]|nr:hypothetical protein CPT76_19340 [Paenibacillus sp. AR247]